MDIISYGLTERELIDLDILNSTDDLIHCDNTIADTINGSTLGTLLAYCLENHTPLEVVTKLNDLLTYDVVEEDEHE